jgi:enamine deaminase RidA (YjgF/YER057c/UK114 family)
VELAGRVDNLQVALEKAGARLGDVARLNHYTTDVAALFGAWETDAGLLLAGGCHPAGTLVGVQALAYPELLIEIEASAVIGTATT